MRIPSSLIIYDIPRTGQPGYLTDVRHCGGGGREGGEQEGDEGTREYH
jgi:hypothetical protein